MPYEQPPHGGRSHTEVLWKDKEGFADFPPEVSAKGLHRMCALWHGGFFEGMRLAACPKKPLHLRSLVLAL